MDRTLKMTLTLAMAAVLAGVSGTCLGLVDAGQELDTTLGRLEQEASVLHRATIAAVEHGATADAMTRPRTALRRAIDSMSTTADRIVRETAPPYARWLAVPLSGAIDLIPATEGMDRALRDYVDQAEQARNETSKSAGAVGLRTRLLDLSYEMLMQRVGEARDRVRQSIARALTAVHMITLVAIGFAALTIGLSSQSPPAPAPYRQRV
jgi:hypothetical protein